MSVNSDNCAKMLKKKKVIDELVRLAIIFSSETEKCEHYYIIRSAVGPYQSRSYLDSGSWVMSRNIPRRKLVSWL